MSFRAILIYIILLLTVEIFGGSVTGYIKSKKDENPVPGATVIVVGTKLGASANPSGYYKIDNIPAGKYTFRVEAVGFKVEEQQIEVSSATEKLGDFLLSEQVMKIQEIIIQARADRELENAARKTEKDAGNVVNVISAQAIEQSTDRTAADVLQRVSGLSVMKDNNGEGRYVVMRGLSHQYNNTLVDGIKIPSPESKDRFIPLDIFPSGLFQRIEVTKSLTPETAGDAIGGSTDILFREAPDKLTLSFSAATGSSESVLDNSFSSFNKHAVNDLDPERMHGTVSDSDPTTQVKARYNPVPSDFTIGNLKFTNKPVSPDALFSGVAGQRFFDGKLGLMAAGSFQNTYNSSTTDIYSLSSDINTVDADGHLIPYAATRNSQSYFTNKIRSGLVLKSDFIADDEDEMSASYIDVRQEEDQVRHALQVQIDGSRGGNDLTYTNRSALRIENIKSFSINGKDFTKSALELRWTLNYTDAVQDRPDEAEYSVLQNYDVNGKLQAFQGLGAITHSWRKNDDHQYLGKIDGIFHISPDGTYSVQFGAVSQKLSRANYQDDYKLNPAIINGHTQPFTSIDSAQVTVFGYGTTSGSSVYGYQNYKADEFLVSTYVQGKAIYGPLQILGGLRWEQAQDEYYTMAAATDAERDSHVKMVNFLPGIHFRYEFTPEQIGHVSITQSMSRPSYFDLVPAVDRSDASQSQGNPKLRPAVATNVDVRYEYYPNSSDVYSLGAYYKKIQDPIENQFQSVGVVLVTSKMNSDPATVYGVEAVLSKHLCGFGLTANYSYVYSAITSTKQVTYVDMNGDLTQTFYKQTRPLESQSSQIANVILSYEDKAWGTNVNCSYNYQGRRLIAVAMLDGYDTYEEGVGTVDFSAEQRILPQFMLNIKLINIFNAPVVTDVISGNYVKHSPIVIERNSNKMRGTIGISYKF